MESELQALEERIRQAANLCHQLRSENVEFRQRIARLESDNARLRERLDAAAERLEALLAKIPE